MSDIRNENPRYAGSERQAGSSEGLSSAERRARRAAKVASLMQDEDYLASREPVRAAAPVEQARPAVPVQPSEPVRAAQSAQPAKRVQPVETVRPAQSAQPMQQTRPMQQGQPMQQARPVRQARPAQEGVPTRAPKSVQQRRKAQPASAPVRSAQPTGRARSAKPVKPAQPASQKKKRNKWTYIFYGALTVFVISLLGLGVMWFSYFQGQQKYDKIADNAAIEVNDIEGKDLKELTVDWDALFAVNPDTVAWVYMPDTPINYPIVQAADNDYYLTRDFDGDQGWLANYGSVFLDYRNSADFSDTVSFVYGHNMNDGSMFAYLANLVDQTRFNQNRTVYLFTPEHNYKLRTVSLLHCSAYDPVVRISFSSNAERTEYLQEKIGASSARATDAPDVDGLNHLVAFATCDDSLNSTGRYILFCYVEDEAATGLTGTIGFNTEGEQGIVDSVGVAS